MNYYHNTFIILQSQVKKIQMDRRNVRYLIIVAGGSGTRMGGPVPKQFMELGGIPVLRRVIDRFIAFYADFRIIIVLPEGKKRIWMDYCDSHEYDIGPHIIADGGFTRFHSVRSALRYVEPGTVAAVHDGVRPFPSFKMLDEMFSLSSAEPALCPAIRSADTLRRLSLSGDCLYAEEDIDRSGVYRIQTPQIFHSEVLIDAYSQPYSEMFTDDASVVESAGYRVRYVPGSPYNLKLTTPEDMVLAQRLLEAGI